MINACLWILFLVSQYIQSIETIGVELSGIRLPRSAIAPTRAKILDDDATAQETSNFNYGTAIFKEF